MTKGYRLSALLIAALSLAALSPVQAHSPPGQAGARSFRAIQDAAAAGLGGESAGKAVATFRLSADGMSMAYKLVVNKMTSPTTMAHIHIGARGDNGPPVVWLFPDVPPPSAGVEAAGVLAAGTITPANLTGPLAGDWDGFLMALRSEALYVNVHTHNFVAGEVRGQIVSQGRSSD